MKTNYFFLILVIFFAGCDLKKDDVDGSDDTPILKLSKYEVPVQGNSVSIEASTYFFYIFEIKIVQNNETTTIVVNDPTVSKQVLTGDWYQIETSLNESNLPSLIKLKISPNTTGIKRTLLISVQRADRFETAIIEQECL